MGIVIITIILFGYDIPLHTLFIIGGHPLMILLFVVCIRMISPQHYSEYMGYLIYKLADCNPSEPYNLQTPVSCSRRCPQLLFDCCLGASYNDLSLVECLSITP